MTFEEILFFMQFITFLGIFLLRVYNQIDGGKFYNFKVGIILTIISSLTYGIGFISFLIQNEKVIMAMLFMLETTFMLFNIIFLLVEFVQSISDKLDKNNNGFYNSLQMRKND